MEEPTTQQPALSDTVRSLLDKFHDLVEQGDFDEAFGVFSELEPTAQGEVFGDLSDEDRQRLVDAILPGDAARILAEFEPEEAVEV